MKTNKKIISLTLAITIFVSAVIVVQTRPTIFDDTKIKPETVNNIEGKPVLELFTIQNKGFNFSELGIKETRWLNDSSLLVNIGVSVNCARRLVDGEISIDNSTLLLKYEITGEEGVLYKCQGYYDLYYVISNIKRGENYNVELKPELNLQ